MPAMSNALVRTFREGFRRSLFRFYVLWESVTRLFFEERFIIIVITVVVVAKRSV